MKNAEDEEEEGDDDVLVMVRMVVVVVVEEEEGVKMADRIMQIAVDDTVSMHAPLSSVTHEKSSNIQM
jgi:hypothetical protein